ncbi:hypothetical protein DVH05_009928 [Phytophthora capsici]|nr:hypothetical protein DVH05_009928 [Phytophthora capsici]
MENSEPKNSREPPVAESAVCEEAEAEPKEAAGMEDEAKEVADVFADIVDSTVASGSEVTTRASVSPAVPVQTQPSSRKRRRAVLQEESVSDEEPLGDDPISIPAPLMQYIVDGDANLMASGAAQCTGLNSDEDTSLQEEQESEDDDDDE